MKMIKKIDSISGGNGPCRCSWKETNQNHAIKEATPNCLSSLSSLVAKFIPLTGPQKLCKHICCINYGVNPNIRNIISFPEYYEYDRMRYSCHDDRKLEHVDYWLMY